MKVFRKITLVLLSALIVPALVFLIGGVTLGGTVFSPAYFNSVFDTSFTDDSVEALAASASSGSDSTAQAMGALLRSKEGSAWLKNELPKALKGSYQYFAAGSGELPAVSIKTLKTWLVETYINQAASGDETGIFKLLIKSELGIDSMKDKLDLNALAKNAYGTKDNPVSGIGPMLLGVRTNLFLLCLAFAVIFVALIAVVAFRGADTLRHVAVPFIVAGALCFLPAASAFVFNGALKAGLADMLGVDASLSFVRDWALSFVNGIALFLLIAAVIAIIAGAVMLVLAKRADRSEGDANPRMALRVVAGLVLVAALPLAFYVFGKATWTSVQKYDGIIRKADGIPFGKALDKTLDSKLFGQIIK